jgi:hypothetical protein
MECQYCKNQFTTKTSLNNHQRTAKYCLKLRTVVNESLYKCDGCDKTFSRSYHLQRHSQNCRSNEKIYQLETELLRTKNDNELYCQKLQQKEEQLTEQKQTIKELHDKLTNIALKAVSRPTTLNKTQVNNFIQNMQPISSHHLLEQSSNLTLEHIQKGASGYAEYALEYPLKERVACVDYSRRKLKFKDNNGNLITDPEMLKLAPMFFDSIKHKSSEIVYDLNNEDMDSSMFESVAKLFNTNADVKNGASGVKSDFYHDFVKHVCSGSVKE